MKSYENINKNAERIASAIHRSISNDKLPIFSLIKWMEENFSIKIKINHINSNNFKSSGLVYYEKEGIYRIWINKKENEYRKNFTLCHELGHIIRSMSLKFGFSTGDIYSDWGIERFCNRFAAAFLMPADLFIYKWTTIKESHYLKKARLVRFFKVSADAVDVRVKELKLI